MSHSVFPELSGCLQIQMCISVHASELVTSKELTFDM